MEQPSSFFALPLAVVAAYIINAIVSREISKRFALVLVSIPVILVSPLLFTHYTYNDSFDGFYSNMWVYSIVIGILVFLALNLLEMKKVWRRSLLLVLVVILSFFALMVMFARGFVGDDAIYAKQSLKGYKVIYRREADAVLSGPLRIDLYRTRVFGLLQKEIGLKYSADNSCIDTLFDKDRSVRILYNHCENKISLK
jgi:hypothetical protein